MYIMLILIYMIFKYQNKGTANDTKYTRQIFKETMILTLD
jgi:hypothetical protein